MQTQMKAAVLYGKEDLQIESVAVPSIGDGDVLVRVQAALTCGTDVKVFRRGYHARMIVPPALFGHELAGDIVAVGKGVQNFQVGQRVVAANSAPCLECFYCKRGSENLCEDLLFNNGAYAEYIRIPARIVERNMYEIPSHVTYQDAALVEPLACVLRGIDETAMRPGDTVAVIGLGPIGLMFVRLAKQYGARVLALGRRKTQLDRAAAMGADELLISGQPDETVENVRKLTGGHGADIAIEAVGNPETWETAARSLRRGGVVNFFGGCPNDSKHSAGHAIAALFGNHLQGQLPSHAGAHPTRAGFCQPGSDHGARFRQPRGAAHQSAGSDAAPDEPQRSHEDRYYSLVPLLAPKDYVNSAEALSGTYTKEQAEQYTRWLATHHYENFHVVSFLLPKRLHQDFYNVYAFCRWADDLGDEIGDTAESLRLLGWWREELEAMYAGRVQHPVYVALEGTARKYDLPQQLFGDLISAFEQDQRVTRYANWEELFDYCRCSANPVGRLVLRLCGYSDAERDRLSDATCTALQLANFWQDVTVDLEKDRVYLPLDLLARHGYTLDDLQAGTFNAAFQGVMRDAIDVARKLFLEGLPLVKTVDKRLAFDLELFSRGGMRVLEKIEQQNYNVLARRPAISKFERVQLLVGSLWNTL